MENLIIELKKNFLDAKDIVRTGARYFCILYNGIKLDQIKNLAIKIHKFIQLYIYSEDNTKFLHLNSLIGSIIFPEMEENSYQCIEKSYIALKNVKVDLGKFYLCYSDYQKDQDIIKQNFKLGYILKKAIVENRISFAYQPIINSKTLQIEYYECLLRINENNQIISAGQFIAAAENLSFINLIDEMVLEAVYKELLLNNKIRLSFNLSAFGVYNEQWLEKALLFFNKKEIAERVIIEITETTIQKDTNSSIDFINKLRKLNCKIALDDFGVGYTSFSQLKNLPIDIIKIDGSFVKNLPNDKNSSIFVNTIIDICKLLNLKTVAEFVEREEVSKFIQQKGADYMQGYFFSPPLNGRPWEKI